MLAYNNSVYWVRIEDIDYRLQLLEKQRKKELENLIVLYVEVTTKKHLFTDGGWRGTETGRQFPTDRSSASI